MIGIVDMRAQACILVVVMFAHVHRARGAEVWQASLTGCPTSFNTSDTSESLCLGSVSCRLMASHFFIAFCACTLL